MESTIKVIGRKVDYLLDTVSCPISTFPFKDPVITADGYTYERIEIEEWLKKSQDSPYTNDRLANKTLMPNKVIKIMSASLIELKGHIAEQEVKLKTPRLEFMNIRDWLDFIGVKDKGLVDVTLKVLASQQIHQTIDVIRRDFEVRSMWLEAGLDRDILELIIEERRKLASYFAHSKNFAFENEKKLELLQSKFDKSLQLATEVIDKYSKMLQKDNNNNNNNNNNNGSNNNEKSSSFNDNLSKGGRNTASNAFTFKSSHALSSTPAAPASASASKDCVALGVEVTKVINQFEGGGGGGAFKYQQQPIKRTSLFDTNNNANMSANNINTQFPGKISFGSSESSSNFVSSATSRVCCPKHHKLHPQFHDNNWFCDASNESGGCKRGVSNGGSTGGVPRFRCGLCDFDYCGPCYESKDNLLRSKVAEASASFDLSSTTIFNPVSLASKSITSNISPTTSTASNAPVSTFTTTATATVASKVVEKKVDSSTLFIFGAKKDNFSASTSFKFPATKEGVVASAAGNSVTNSNISSYNSSSYNSSSYNSSSFNSSSFNSSSYNSSSFNSSSFNSSSFNSSSFNSNSNNFTSSKPVGTQWFKHPEPSVTKGKKLVKTSITKSLNGAFGLTLNKIKVGVHAGGVIILDPLEGPALLCNPSLRVGDIIIGINGSAIRDYDLFMNAIRKMSSSNPKVELWIERESGVNGDGGGEGGEEPF